MAMQLYSSRKSRNLIILVILGTPLLCSLAYLFATLQTSAAPNGMIFPLIGEGRFSNDFNAPRSNGQHNATDIVGFKGQRIVSVTDGTVIYAPAAQPSWGYMVTVEDSEGYRYDYIHLNNDTPGSDDGVASAMTAYAPDIKQGNSIKKGQLLGYVGDSGNAESTVPHLHLEITAPDGTKINPYDYLVNAQRIAAPVTYPALNGETLPYGINVGAPVSIATGNFDADSRLETVVAAGPGGGPHVRVFDDDNIAIDQGGFNAYASSFTGGVNIATGDINGDGIDEIITGTGPGSSTHVGIFTHQGAYLGGFFAYRGFNTGVNVAAGDIDNDGKDEIFTGPSVGSSTHVKIFTQYGGEINSFFAYPGYNVGVDIAVGDVVGDSNPEIITSAGPGGGSHVAIFSLAGTYLNGYFVYPGFYGGTRVTVGNINTQTSKLEIVTAPWTSGGPDIRAHDFTGNMVANGSAYESWWSSGYDVAVGSGTTNNVKLSLGEGRRSSFRSLTLRD